MRGQGGDAGARVAPEQQAVSVLLRDACMRRVHLWRFRAYSSSSPVEPSNFFPGVRRKNPLTCATKRAKNELNSP